jgi:hypothetical protein
MTAAQPRSLAIEGVRSMEVRWILGRSAFSGQLNLCYFMR